MRAMDRLIRFGKDVVNGWLEAGAFTLAASLAYYAIFSIAPLSWSLIHLASLFLDRSAAVEGLTKELVGLIGPTGSDAIKQMLDAAGTAQPHGWAGLVGIAVFFERGPGPDEHLVKSREWLIRLHANRSVAFRHFRQQRLVVRAVPRLVEMELPVELLSSREQGRTRMRAAQKRLARVQVTQRAPWQTPVGLLVRHDGPPELPEVVHGFRTIGRRPVGSSPTASPFAFAGVAAMPGGCVALVAGGEPFPTAR